MSDSEFILNSSTRAIADSEEAFHLIEQKERLEQAIVSKDPAVALDTAKAFLESMLKTILSDRVESPDLNQDMSQLYKSVRDVLPLNRDNDANDILKKLTNNIVHNVAKLRNDYGAASHGDDGYFENPIEMPEAEMVAHLVDGMTAFLYKKHKTDGNPTLSARIYYNEYPEYNDFLDGQWEGYSLPLSEKHEIDLPASKLIYIAEQDVYREMLLQYMSTEEEDSEEE